MIRRLLALLASTAILAGCASTSRPDTAAGSAMPPVHPSLAGMQYLYGSGEGAAISRQSWTALVDYVTLRLTRAERDSVVLAENSSLEAPSFVACGDRPKAVVFDMDETTILNLGFEYDDLAGEAGRPFGARWKDWEQHGAGAIVATPGARGAIAKLRAMNVAVIYNTNRENVAGALAALQAAGLGPATHLDTLFVKGDDDKGDLKDARRLRISRAYCVIAMGGDQLGDFSDLFNMAGATADRRARTEQAAILPLWGHGWFLFPNPVYGKALKGGPDDIFPADRRWHPTGGQ